MIMDPFDACAQGESEKEDEIMRMNDGGVGVVGCTSNFKKANMRAKPSGQKKREIENINVCVLMSIHFAFETLHYMSLSHLSVRD